MFIPAICLLCWSDGANPSVNPQAVQLFEAKVRPVLIEGCFPCHGPKKQRGGLRLDSRAGLLTGGDHGPALVPGAPEWSLLISAVRQTDELKMPPKKKLPSAQIADLARWIQLGAPWPDAGPAPSAGPPSEYPFAEEGRPHWAFQPLRRPAVPPVTDRAWPKNPIDAFILAGLEATGIAPNPPATKRELIRRVYYDLTGLPPAPAEVEAFAADPSPTAYAALVDRLLGSPHYGEKWGRHWLDLVRFAETNSYERDNPKPNAWRYRDYVIRAFNHDTPYDRFIREQLAGDELAARRDAALSSAVEAVIATGYYRLGIWDDEPTDPEQARYDGLDDIVATTGQVFLGLTLDCARCHDHKLDPIAQKDYYRLLAFFHNIHPYRNGGPTDEMRVVATPDGRQTCVPLIPDPADKPGPRRKKPRAGDTVLCVSEAGRQAPPTFVLLRGNPHVRGLQVEPGFPRVFQLPDPAIPTPPPAAATTGRRLVLANWIASADNPMTARVMANRLWQHHFGRGIVRSSNNFGLQGDKPTHPQLVDWLAAELIATSWRLKPLHRLMLLSNAYQMSSRGNPRALALDPVNDRCWRFDVRRLGAEEIRDSMLAVTGQLNPRMYGPGVYVDIPREVLAGQSMPGAGWGKSSAREQARRSIYIHVKRSLLTPILESFDLAETDRTSPVRFVTIQPTQALGMLNGEFPQQQAKALAARVRHEAGPDVGGQVRLVLSLVTSRPPQPAETERGVRFLRAVMRQGHLGPEAALADYCLLALNLNEFLFLD